MRYTRSEIEEAIKEKRWPPPAMQCPECLQLLQSKWPGQFVTCFCGESFIDQTPYYSRYGGKVCELNKKKRGK